MTLILQNIDNIRDSEQKIEGNECIKNGAFSPSCSLRRFNDKGFL